MYSYKQVDVYTCIDKRKIILRLTDYGFRCLPSRSNC